MCLARHQAARQQEVEDHPQLRGNLGKHTNDSAPLKRSTMQKFTTCEGSNVYQMQVQLGTNPAQLSGTEDIPTSGSEGLAPGYGMNNRVDPILLMV